MQRAETDSERPCRHIGSSAEIGRGVLARGGMEIDLVNPLLEQRTWLVECHVTIPAEAENSQIDRGIVQECLIPRALRHRVGCVGVELVTNREFDSPQLAAQV
jgi:hypothetical protein